MLFKFSFFRIFIIFLLVILFPLVQNQWLNLYLFDINNFSIYKLLYYLSGLICPIFVCLISLNSFTYYKFINEKIKNSSVLSGKLLFITTFIVLFSLSSIISSYIFTNINLFLNAFIKTNNDIIQFYNDKNLFLILLISILLIFKRGKLFIKKTILINFFIFSIIIWFSKVNNIFLINQFPFNNILIFENINYINVLYLLIFELFYYIWSYISFGSFLSDWQVPIPSKKQILDVINIIFFYLLILIYYSMLYG